jgi:4-hydroxymandelate oxidase
MAADRSPALLSLADYEHAAAARMTARAHGYIDGGAGDEITVRENEAAWRRLALRPRMLATPGGVDRSVSVLGVRRPHPLLVAPTAFAGLAHPDGSLGIARAAAATSTIMCVATFGGLDVEAVAAGVPDGTRWFQLYVMRDRGVTREHVARATAAGCEALLVTIDRPVLGLRARELRADVRQAGEPAADRPVDTSTEVDPALTWDDVERLAADSPLPVLVKGVLTAEDARIAAGRGLAGVIVSNHGGRQLDTALPGADALPEVADAVGDRLDVLVDGGIRRGTDIVKALALGARAVLVGRPLLWGLALEGEAGGRRVIELLLSELETALTLTGAPRADQVDRSFVTRAPWEASPG